MKYYLYCFSLLITSFVYSQNQKTLSDSEYQKLHDKARLLINSNVDSSFICANKIEKSNNNLHKSFAFGIKSYLYQLKGDSLKSKQYYKTSLTYLSKLKPSVEKTKLNSYILAYGGLAEWKRKNFSKSLVLYQQGKNISKSISDYKQIFKFNYNISSIYGEIEDFSKAIKTVKESDQILNREKHLYDDVEFMKAKSNIYFNLGKFYKKLSSKQNRNRVYLDSSEYYLKKTILYSKNLQLNKINAEITLSDIYFLRKEYSKSEKLQLQIFNASKSNNLTNEFSLINRNLGNLYYILKNYNKAIVYFKKVDSIYSKNKSNNKIAEDFLYSNYYQANIATYNNESALAFEHSKIFLENFETTQQKLEKEKESVNFILSQQDLKKEMLLINDKYKFEKNINKFIKILVFVVIIFLILGVIRYRNQKIKINKKLDQLIAEYKNNINLQPTLSLNAEEISKKGTNLSIDEKTEISILNKLYEIESKEEFIKENFTLQYVAKKAKTNTTYLSYVVNKNFGKSFSEYANELKINFVINQMISNPMYRKYSTQAIAESVGFKNAISFTKSFSKRTGVTPSQFAKKIENS